MACGVNGMTAYSQTWLQFVFPVYVWVLIILDLGIETCFYNGIVETGFYAKVKVQPGYKHS